MGERGHPAEGVVHARGLSGLRSLAAIKLQNRIQVAASYYPSRITFHAGGIVIEAENFYYPSNPRKSLGNDRGRM